MHRAHIDAWGGRRASIVVGDLVDGPMLFTDPYMTLYRQITVLYVGDPTRPPHHFGYRGVGSTVEILVNSLYFSLYEYMFSHNFLRIYCSSNNLFGILGTICQPYLSSYVCQFRH